MSVSVPQRQRALALYKRLVRTSQKTFEGDQPAVAAFAREVRTRYQQLAHERDPAKIEEALKLGEDVVNVLRQNVVQGKLNEQSNAWRLRMTKDTELGTNDSIKKAREQQIADLKAGKAPSRRSCREMAAEVNSSTIFGSSAPSSSSGPSSSGSARTFSTSTLFADRRSARVAASPILRATFSTSSSVFARDPTAVASTPLPRPVPKFSSITVLADGSSIELHTTSPRRLTRLTRDPTNHPLWNPGMERRVGGDAGDDSGRLGRFRKRFGENEAAPAAGPSAATAKRGATDAGDVAFGQEDLDWMSVGGRVARAGSPLAAKKAAKGKGKK